MSNTNAAQTHAPAREGGDTKPQGSGHWIITPRNGGKSYRSDVAPDGYELRECSIQWIPQPQTPDEAHPGKTMPDQQPKSLPIDDFLADYVMEGDDGSYAPTEHERFVAKDAFLGLLAECERNAAPTDAAQAPVVPAAWQPIETAPTSGATILLWWRNAGACTGGFRIDEDWNPTKPTPESGWAGEADGAIPCNQEDCTHWMLLPDAPFGHRYPNFAGHRARQEILKEIYATTIGAQAHPDDLAVDRFAAAMKAKLARSRAKGRSGWQDPEQYANAHLARLLVEHLFKANEGTFEDVANLAMMLHHRDAHPSEILRATAQWGPRPMSGAEVCAYGLPGDDIRIERVKTRDGRVRWAVRTPFGDVMARDGAFGPEPSPSNRDDAFLARCRFDTPEAAYAAWAGVHAPDAPLATTPTTAPTASSSDRDWVREMESFRLVTREGDPVMIQAPANSMAAKFNGRRGVVSQFQDGGWIAVTLDDDPLDERGESGLPGVRLRPDELKVL